MPRKLVTTSKDSSAHGRAFMSPTLMSAPGLRSRATATSRGEASMPAQVAPRRLARPRARPEPQGTAGAAGYVEQAVAGVDLEPVVDGDVLAAVAGFAERGEVDRGPAPAFV